MGMKHYSKEFKREAVKLVTEQKKSVREAAQELGVAHESLRSWIRKSSASEPSASEVSKDEQIKQLQKENRRLKMEQEILKKATAFFAKDQL